MNKIIKEFIIGCSCIAIVALIVICVCDYISKDKNSFSVNKTNEQVEQEQKAMYEARFEADQKSLFAGYPITLEQARNVVRSHFAKNEFTIDSIVFMQLGEPYTETFYLSGIGGTNRVGVDMVIQVAGTDLRNPNTKQEHEDRYIMTISMKRVVATAVTLFSEMGMTSMNTKPGAWYIEVKDSGEMAD